MRFQLFDYLKDIKIPYKESGKNIGEGWVGICCPACFDHNFHLGVHKDSGNFYCWICGVKGNLPQLIELIENIPIHEAYQRIKEFQPSYPLVTTDLTLSDYLRKQFFTSEKQGEDSSATCSLPQYIVPLSVVDHYPDCTLYLQNRGFEKSDWVKWGAYFCYAGKYKYRIIFPLTINQKLMTFVSRSIFNVEARYLNAPKSESILSARNCIYNYDKINDGDEVIICEGILDALKVEKLTGKKVVALMGKVLSHKQKLLLLMKNMKQVWVMLDKDAWKETMKMQNTLASLLACPVIASYLRTEKDPGELKTREQCINLL